MNEQNDAHSGNLSELTDKSESVSDSNPLATTTELAQLILDTAEEGFCLFSASNQRVAAFNRQFADFLNLDTNWLADHPTAEEVAKAIYDREKHHHRRNLTGYLRRVLDRHQKAGEWNLELNLADGRTIVGRSQSTPGGERLYTTRDVTQYRKIMHELEDERQRLSTMVEHAPVAYFVIDCASTTVTQLNRSIEHLTGYPADSFLNSENAWLRTVHHDDRSFVEANRTPAVISRRPYDIQYRRIHEDSSVRWFREMAEVVPETHTIKHPRPRRMAGVLIDITRQKVAEALLRESERRFRELIEGIPDLIFYEHDPDRKLTYVSPSVKHILGLEPHEMIGRRFGERPDRNQSDADLKQAYRFVAEAIRTGRRQPRYEIRVRAQTGEPVMLEIHEYPVTDQDATVIGFRGVARDITAVRAMEQRLRQRERLAILGTFAGGLAHDLNNLLLPIRASLETIERKPDPVTVKERVNAIRLATDHIGDLVRKLLFWTRQDSSKTLRAVVTDLRQWAIRATEFYQETLRSNASDDNGDEPCIKIRLDDQWSDPTPPPPLAVDPDLLKQAVLNLVLNARDAMPDGGNITLAFSKSPDDWIKHRISLDDLDTQSFDQNTEPNHDEMNDDFATTQAVRITVTDDGEGMNESITDRAFDPFFSTKARGKSTGLGLALVRTIIQSADGAIHIKSKKGKGTSIHIDIPAVTGNRQPDQSEELSPRGNAVIQSSEPMTAAFLASALKQLGYEPRIQLHDFPNHDDKLWVVNADDVDPRDLQTVLANQPELIILALGPCKNPTAWPDAVLWHDGPINVDAMRKHLQP